MKGADVSFGDHAATVWMPREKTHSVPTDISAFGAIDMISSVPAEVGRRIVGMLPSDYLSALLQSGGEVSTVVSSCIKAAKANTNRAGLISLKKFPFLRDIDIRATYELTEEELSTLLSTQQLKKICMRADQLLLTSDSDRILSRIRKLSIAGCLNFSNDAIHCIAGFHQLEELDMQYCLNRPSIMDFVELQHVLHLNLSLYENINSLAKFNLPASLKTLNLSRCTGLHHLDALSDIKELTALDLSWTVLQSTKALPGLKRLKRLKLIGCQIDDLQGTLASMPGVQELDLSRIKSPLDIRGLLNMAHLSKLALSECSHVEGLDWLGKLGALKSMDLTRCELPISFPGFLPGIEGLNLSANRSIVSLSRLGELGSLRNLNLSGCTQLKDIEALEHSPELQTLNLRNCTSIQDFSVIGRLKKLKTLVLTGCKDGIPNSSLFDIMHRLNMENMQVRALSA